MGRKACQPTHFTHSEAIRPRKVFGRKWSRVRVFGPSWQQNHSGVFTSEDGARSWKRVIQQDAGVHFGFPIAADNEDAKTAWVVPLRGDQERMTIGGGLSVARTRDGGASWQSFREGLPQEHCYDVIYRHALDASVERVCFGSTTGNVYVSEDRGETWCCIGNNLPPIHSVRFA